MSNNDPTLPTTPAPLPTPPTVASSGPLNPTLMSTYAFIASAVLTLAAIICATILAAVHDGAYVSQAFALFNSVVLVGGGGTAVMGTAHVLVKGFRG